MNNIIKPPAIVQEVDLGESLVALSGVIERNAQELTRVKNELKEKRQSLKSVYDNDSELANAQEVAKQHSQAVKERKARLKSDHQVVSLNTSITELREQAKELEETLSGHLVSYHQMTNSTSFDTSDGDQWDFSVKAKVKPRQLKLFEN